MRVRRARRAPRQAQRRSSASTGARRVTQRGVAKSVDRLHPSTRAHRIRALNVYPQRERECGALNRASGVASATNVKAGMRVWAAERTRSADGW